MRTVQRTDGLGDLAPLIGTGLRERLVGVNGLLLAIQRSGGKSMFLPGERVMGWRRVAGPMAAFREYLADPQRFEQARDMLHDGP